MSIEDLINKARSNYQIIFDLDNTIYKETDFLFKAYDFLAQTLFPVDHREVLKFMVGEFTNYGRQDLFNKVLERFPSEPVSVSKMLACLRDYRSYDTIAINPWFEIFLKGIPVDFKVNIITNGNPTQQRNKIFSLGLHNKIKYLDVVYANEIAAKPSNLCAMKFINYGGPTIYVGDSSIDLEFARQCNFKFIDVTSLVA